MIRLARNLALTLPLLTACGGERGDEGGNQTSGIALTTGGPGQVTAQKLDALGGGSGTAGSAEQGAGDGCEKVDFLFIIDSSGSMQDEQTNLLNSFPGFITAIQDTLGFNDFHLMVIDAGQLAGAGCDGTLGAGLTTSATGQDCMLAGGRRYADENQPDLVAAFSCAGARGFMGPNDEQTMDSMVAAIGPLNGAGECNEGFVRDDAVLVITVISDEEDDPADGVAAPPLDGSCVPADSDANSSGDPSAWFDAVVAAKNGDPNAVVVLGLLGDCDAGGSCPGIQLDPFNPAAPITGAEPAPRLRSFVSSFNFGSLGPVCSADYAPFFEAAVGDIANACDDFIPPA